MIQIFQTHYRPSVYTS